MYLTKKEQFVRFVIAAAFAMVFIGLAVFNRIWNSNVPGSQAGTVIAALTVLPCMYVMWVHRGCLRKS